ncbi:MAG: DUF6089 family protein, partial [Bacteroidota bacterium]
MLLNTIHQIRFFFTAALIFTLASSAWSQKSEVGFFFGTTYYLGDLNPLIHFSQSRPGFGALYRYNIDQNISV